MRPWTLRARHWTRFSFIRRRATSQKVTPQSSTTSKSIPQSSSAQAASNSVAQSTHKQQSRLDRLLIRTPKFLHRHVSALRNAPITHVSAFLVLHEITAVVPLFGLAGVFHYYQWLPSYFSEGAWVVAGVEMFGRYFKRKGWISGDQEQEAERLSEKGEAGTVEKKSKFAPSNVWNKGEGGVRLVVEFATAYAIVKALLVPRLVLSAWAAPWFAKWSVIPVMNVARKVFRRSKIPTNSP